ncbi:MAG: helix-turn-helix domain-containing protein, partial [Cyanobacteria bacterium P01_G01_bin.38]
NIFDEFPFLIAEVAPPHYPEPDLFAEFDKLGDQLMAEFQSSSPYKFNVIGNLTVILLLRIKEWFWKSYNPLEESDTGSAIALTFKRNLENHFRDLVDGRCDRLYQVQDYAEAQYLHPSYFSTVIKRKTGKSVNAWIAEKTIAEAQALLARSTQSVQEIAFRLGFKDAAHFSRFFKKHTALSPSQFRQQA